MLRVFVETSDFYNWALGPFAYLFNTYWSSAQEVVIAGYRKPTFSLPSNFKFHMIDSHNYPQERWSNGIIKFLHSVNDDHFVFMLADYWLTRTVDVRGVASLHDYISGRPDVLRMDLTSDRLYAGGMFDVESWGSYDIVETPHGTPYQMSFQAAIWNRKLLLQVLQPNKSAWESEIHLHPPIGMRVLGSRQWPVKYANSVYKGSILRSEIDKIPEEHRSLIYEKMRAEWKQPDSVSVK